MTLSKWVALMGDERAAEILGVAKRTAKAYRLGETTPTSKRAKEFVELTGGKVSFKGCFEGV